MGPGRSFSRRGTTALHPGNRTLRSAREWLETKCESRRTCFAPLAAGTTSPSSRTWSRRPEGAISGFREVAPGQPNLGPLPRDVVPGTRDSVTSPKHAVPRHIDSVRRSRNVVPVPRTDVPRRRYVVPAPGRRRPSVQTCSPWLPGHRPSPPGRRPVVRRRENRCDGRSFCVDGCVPGSRGCGFGLPRRERWRYILASCLPLLLAGCLVRASRLWS